jgi:hypothetical protein
MGNHVVRTSVSIFPYSELGKNLKLVNHCWASGRMLARTEASRYSGDSGRKDTSSGWMTLVCLVSERDDTSSGRME